MNELNQLENRLSSWTPRSPSPSIKKLLFPKENGAAAADNWAQPISWRWLAPAMALCFGAVLVLAKSDGARVSDPRHARVMPTLALSNLDFATYFAAASQNDHNMLPAATTFEWTNGAHSSTT